MSSIGSLVMVADRVDLACLYQASIPDVHHHREADDLGRRVEITEGVLHCRKLRNSRVALASTQTWAQNCSQQEISKVRVHIHKNLGGYNDTQKCFPGNYRLRCFVDCAAGCS
jgi:hypothetical protein